jgi:hypothetical protein
VHQAYIAMAASGIVTEAQRNVFNTVRQAFAFSRSFLNKVRREGAIFHSPFPDYYLANMAIGMGDTIDGSRRVARFVRIHLVQ